MPSLTRPLTHVLIALAAAAAFGACGGDPDPAGPADAVPADVVPVDAVAPDADDSPDADAAPADATPPGPGVAIVEPAAAGVLSGTLPVVLAAVGDGPDERVLDGVRLDVNGLTVFRGALLPDRFLLDTTAFDATELRLEAHAVIEDAPRTDAVDLTVNNRPYRFLAVDPAATVYPDGAEVAVDVTLSHTGATLAADFSAVDSAYVAGAAQVAPLGDARFRITYRISNANSRPDGLYRVPIRATYPGWAIDYDGLELRLLNRPVLPVRVDSAIEVREARPNPSGWTAALPTLTSNSTLVTGGSLALRVDFRDVTPTSDVVGLVVALDHTHGFLHIPLQNSSGLEELRLNLRQYAPDESPPASLTLAVALVDRRGNVSNYATRTLNVLSVGAGDLQISVSWDSPTDVDLHVTGPGPTAASPSCTVYYANKTCASGGQLDLDSNPACNLDNINNENVFWDTSQAAPGDYEVKLRYWSDCGCCSARYTVSVVNCGETTTYEGILLQGTSGSSSPFREVATVSSADCGRSVAGHARYEDRVITPDGARVATMRPARHALVEVRRADDDLVIGSGRTDAAGDFRVSFPHDPGVAVYVALVSRTDPNDGVRHIEVLEHPYRRDTYEVASDPFVPSPAAADLRVPTRVDLDVRGPDGAGAFNIFDQIVTGYDLVRRMTGRDLTTLRAFWTVAEDGAETAYCTSARYSAGACIEPRSVTIQGFEDDPDEFDDQVILRAFFGFALDRASKNDNPGGPADGRRVDPRVAWAEGAATFFAADVLGRTTYADSRPHGVTLVTDLETPWSPFARGVDDELVSPHLVSAILHDLADGVDAAEAHDPVDRRRQGIYDVIFNRLRAFATPDRGPEGVDLTDFLDGFICRGYGAEATVSPLVTERAFAYDFAGPATCP